jgi:hypothetical protein
MVHQTAESLLEIGILAGRGVQAGLCRFGRNMRRNIVAQMEDALTAVVCLLLMLHTAEDSVNKRDHGFTVYGGPTAVIGAVMCV